MLVMDNSQLLYVHTVVEPSDLGSGVGRQDPKDGPEPRQISPATGCSSQAALLALGAP